MSLVLGAVPALAETYPPVDTAQSKSPATAARPARSGFQMAIRSGASLPFGRASGESGDYLDRRYSYHIPLVFDLGAKLTETVYLGAYLGFGIGAEGKENSVERYCEDNDDDLENDIACTSASVKLGLQAQYHFRPDQRWNPWVGYGIGFEGILQSLHDHESGYDESTYSGGTTWAQLDVGIDYRRAVGVGPFLQFAIGEYTSAKTEVNGNTVFDGAIEDRTLHVWVTLGARLVILP